MTSTVAPRFGLSLPNRGVLFGATSTDELLEIAREERPHCSALGKVLLSHLSESQVRAIVGRTGLPARTAATITDVDWLLRELEETRARGFAVDDEEDYAWPIWAGVVPLSTRVGEPVPDRRVLSGLTFDARRLASR